MAVKQEANSWSLRSWNYGNSCRFSDELCYVVVPKCGSTTLVRQLGMTEKYNSNYKTKFTFIRHPYDRIKAYMWQQNNARTPELIQDMFQRIIKNFDNHNEHCYCYSVYIKFEDFDFIGCIETFDRDIRKLVSKATADSILNDHNKTLLYKKNKKYLEFSEYFNSNLQHNKRALRYLYKRDFSLFEKVKHAH